jgi:hypothetical protein
MDKRTLASKLIANFGTLLTLPELTLDEHSNSCVLLFDGDIVSRMIGYAPRQRSR